jgi:uncharacterized protein YjbI with pentapeptide repeats
VKFQNLSGFDLSGFDLSGFDLQGFDLRSFGLQGSDLQGKDLKSWGCIFEGILLVHKVGNKFMNGFQRIS